MKQGKLATRMKTGRNKPCPCGSGLKYKRCHGNIFPHPSDGDVVRKLERHRADELIREQQQGLGRPIISVRNKQHQIVAVRNRVFWSKQWKTFPDFLAHYIKTILDPAWGNAEIAKPMAERHTILQWYDRYCRYQQETITTPGVVTNAIITGVVACYLGLAYGLYLLDHNVELQRRLVNRLKDPGNFQGAYYEVMIASTLIRAGFELALEDEGDPLTKHCEFSAISKHTGKKYWVEAKMRAVARLLSRTDADGSADVNPLSRFIPHLNGALGKPAENERLVFIDLNAPMDGDVSEENPPDFMDRAIRRLEKFEADGEGGKKAAYVFVTNTPFHRMLGEPARAVIAPFGLNIPDFNKSGMFGIYERYQQEQKHQDAIKIAESFSKYTVFPSTFDGSLPAATFGSKLPPLVIGQTYLFENGDGTETLGTVTTASMNEAEKTVYFGITTESGVSEIRAQKVSDEELADYRAHSDGYFGRVLPVGKKIGSALEMFEWLLPTYSKTPKHLLLDWMSTSPDVERLKTLEQKELAAIYCEGLAANFMKHVEKKNTR